MIIFLNRQFFSKETLLILIEAMKLIKNLYIFIFFLKIRTIWWTFFFSFKYFVYFFSTKPLNWKLVILWRPQILIPAKSDAIWRMSQIFNNWTPAQRISKYALHPLKAITCYNTDNTIWYYSLFFIKTKKIINQTFVKKTLNWH